MPLVTPAEYGIIRPSDFDLSACGLPVPPDDRPYIDLAKSLIYSRRVSSGAAGLLLDEKKQVDQDADFYLAGIQGTQLSNLYIRFRYATGRYSANIREHSTDAFSLWDQRRAIDPPQRFPAGSWIGIEIDYRTGAAVDLVISFDGFKRVYLCEK